MVHKDGIKVKGLLTLWLLDPDTGRTVEERICSNLVVSTGISWLAGRAAGASLMNLSAIAVGTGNTAPAAGDTGLVVEIERASLMMAPWQGMGSDINTLYARASFATGDAVGTLAEAGLYFGTTLFSRTLISPTLAKTSDKILVAQWAISFSGT